MITCAIDYVIDPSKIEAFEQFGRAWMDLVRRHGGIHHGYDRDVLIATILSNSICKPMAVVARETRSYAASPSAGAAQIRREPGRGNIYPVQFFLPGYQLVFVRMLAGAFFDKAAIIEEALLALAKQVVRGDLVRGAPAGEDAQAFARRMVALAGPRFTSTSEAAW